MEKTQLGCENEILHSFNLSGQEMCVDIFQRPDGTFGFEEYRRGLGDPNERYGILTDHDGGEICRA